MIFASNGLFEDILKRAHHFYYSLQTVGVYYHFFVSNFRGYSWGLFKNKSYGFGLDQHIDTIKMGFVGERRIGQSCETNKIKAIFHESIFHVASKIFFTFFALTLFCGEAFLLNSVL